MAEADERYDPKSIEPKWQSRWEDADIFRTTEDPGKPKAYGLDFFPYPSGAGISVGHCRNYIPTDVYCRLMRMAGHNVLHPMGWDAFGLPAENEAIQKRSHPKKTVPQYIATYKRQMKLIGIGYDWSREINSSDPSYYRWTQWCFNVLFRRGLAYRSFAPANWCPSCRTVLANEEVQGGLCWRCGSPAEKKQLPQWFFKITDYADRLLYDLDDLDWPEGIKMMQRNWIGRSEGVEFQMEVAGTGKSFRAFTTRIDTIFGVTFCVFAPEHPLVAEVTAPECRAAVEEYVRQAQHVSEMDRMAAERERTGVFTGAYAINPVNGEHVPIWVADYVLMGYGTGAIMAVPGHDERDFDFARKYGLEIRRVICPPGKNPNDPITEAEPADGVMVNSGDFTGLPSDEGKERLAEWFESRGLGERKVNYRLRDWLISRQRYWGAPIPIVHCTSCGEVAVPDEQLPVLLPDVENYEPSGTGESPLAAIPEFVDTSCPRCGRGAKRETDTMGGFACSSWYFLRFADPHNQERAWDPEKVAYWLPVDCYVGGAEHAVMHLLYARFWTKVFYDAGLVPFQEPFERLVNQGMVLAQTPYRRPREGERLRVGEEGILISRPEAERLPSDQVIWKWEKMSKSKGNVVTPEEVVDEYGADALRVYELFVAPFDMNVQWSTEGIVGANRFLGRVWRLFWQARPLFIREWRDLLGDEFDDRSRELRRKTHTTIKRVCDDIRDFRFNTAVAAMMEWLNAIADFVQVGTPERQHRVALSEAVEAFMRLLSPIAPHIADELWERYGFTGFLFLDQLPVYDEAVAAADEVTIAVQVNGKLRATLSAPASASNSDLEQLALGHPKVTPHLAGVTVRKVIVVPGRLVNIVAN
ncbi:MAG: leucine--tRNA ligase [Fimbriimonadia bacterium]|jgi:leucyl-tRNA synthetase